MKQIDFELDGIPHRIKIDFYVTNGGRLSYQYNNLIIFELNSADNEVIEKALDDMLEQVKKYTKRQLMVKKL